MLRKWRKISRRLVYKNFWIKVQEDIVVRPDGKKGIYSFIEKPAGNFIIALDKDDSVYLIKEFRYVLQKSIWQLPAGVSETKNIVQQSKKELLEETGIVASKWKKLGGFYVAPGHETTYINVILATGLDLSQKKTSNQESDESILEVRKVKVSQLKKMVKAGKIECGISVAALNLFFLEHEIKAGSYSSTSEFFRHLLREWQEAKLLKELRAGQREFASGKGKILKSLKDLR